MQFVTVNMTFQMPMRKDEDGRWVPPVQELARYFDDSWEAMSHYRLLRAGQPEKYEPYADAGQRYARLVEAEKRLDAERSGG